MDMQVVATVFTTQIFVHPSSPTSPSISLGWMGKKRLASKVKAKPDRFKAWAGDNGVRQPVVFP